MISQMEPILPNPNYSINNSYCINSLTNVETYPNSTIQNMSRDTFTKPPLMNTEICIKPQFTYLQYQQYEKDIWVKCGIPANNTQSDMSVNIPTTIHPTANCQNSNKVQPVPIQLTVNDIRNLHIHQSKPQSNVTYPTRSYRETTMSSDTIKADMPVSSQLTANTFNSNNKIHHTDMNVSKHSTSICSDTPNCVNNVPPHLHSSANYLKCRDSDTDFNVYTYAQTNKSVNNVNSSLLVCNNSNIFPVSSSNIVNCEPHHNFHHV